MLAVGQAFVLVGGGFDLLQGATLALTAAVTAYLATSLGLSPWPAAPIALMIGASLGLYQRVLRRVDRHESVRDDVEHDADLPGAAFVFLAWLADPAGLMSSAP